MRYYPAHGERGARLSEHDRIFLLEKKGIVFPTGWTRAVSSTNESSAAWSYIARHRVINYSERVRAVTNILLTNISTEEVCIPVAHTRARARACIESSPEHCIIVYCTYHSSVICVKRKRGIKRLSAKESIMDAELHREFNARNLFNSISAVRARTRMKLRTGRVCPVQIFKTPFASSRATFFSDALSTRDRWCSGCDALLRVEATIPRRSRGERTCVIT